MEIIIFLINLIFDPSMGLLGLVFGLPFAWTMLLVSLILTGLYYGILKRLKDPQSLVRALYVYIVGSLLFWVTLYFSYKDIYYPIGTEYDFSKMGMGTAGFPIRALTYPFPPMGGDQPPLEMWPKFFLNFAIWFIVAAIIAKFFPKQFKNPTLFFYIVFSVYLLLWGIGFIFAKFD